ncbi:Aste57867_14335 [Aphanomyces stellatus]|uniref:Aste57867_14335 protein n=1 Tax=Aphanomyces stellatus TaxID=120398 RepID=A0A485L0Y9_9STRA|nr:hypothetical protein As57867_014281 [Aphanomyces stellatus]VFT91159.1 Aste57867_14335 [Aphanomyces stellatus]
MTHKCHHRVTLNRKSVVLSTLFSLNLVAMPLKVYLSEVAPLDYPATYRPSPAFPPISSAPPRTSTLSMRYVQQLQLLYNETTLPHGATYEYDATNDVEVMRTVVSPSACCDTSKLVSNILGSVYFTPDVKTDLALALCATNTSTQASVGRMWQMNFFAAHDYVCATWIVPRNDVDDTPSSSATVSTVYSTFIPVSNPTSWRIVKLTYRLGLCLWIARICIRHYYDHVRHLRSTLRRHALHIHATADHYEIVVGEPTCLVLSNPFLCTAFIVDIWSSEGSVAQAGLRVCQTQNPFLFFAGMVYLSRMVWCAYWSLAVLNPLLQRTRHTHWVAPANTTVLALAAFLGGGGLPYLQGLWPALVSVYTFLLSLDSTRDASTGHIVEMNTAIVLFVYSLTMAALPCGVAAAKATAGFLSSWIHARRSRPKILSLHVRSTLRRLSLHGRNLPLRRDSMEQITAEPPRTLVESQADFNDFKHQLILWLCHVGPKAQSDLCTGGSLYPLFRAFPACQTHATMSQRGSDCYVFGYTDAKTLIEVTRVSLRSQMDLAAVPLPTSAISMGASATTMGRFPIQEAQLECAVGRLVMSKSKRTGALSVAFFRGVGDSPWVA